MYRAVRMAVIATLFVTLWAVAAHAEEWEKYDKPVPTMVVVRVLSHGAKAMSQRTGALVVLRDARTGAELDKGGVEGDTGDTTALMKASRPRGSGITGLLKGDRGVLLKDKKATEPEDYYDLVEPKDPKDIVTDIYESKVESAKFVGQINITKPTQVLVEVYGPLLPKHAMASAITTTWVFPGENITGEGIVVDLRGLIVDAKDSLREKVVQYAEAKDGIDVDFFMRMMCGCPITPGEKGKPWQAEGYKVTTQAYYKGKLYYEDVKTADKLFLDISYFKTTVPLPKDLPEGKYDKERLKIRLMASQASQANYGIDEFNMYISNSK